MEFADKIDRAYSSEPWWYDLRGFLILTFSYRTTLPSQIRLFAAGMGREHLEIAIGTGTLFELILRWRRWRRLPEVSITGFDYADRMLAGARHRFSGERRIRLLRADAAKLSFADRSFETANVANALHCLPDMASSLAEIHRVLKPGGTLTGNCLLEPTGRGPLAWLARKINRWGMKKGLLHRPYRKEEILHPLLAAGFSIKFQEVRGNCLNFTAGKVSE